MHFDVVTLSPGMFVGPFDDGVLSRARRSGTVSVRVHDLRRWGTGRHRQVDDQPYGGGGGMVLAPGPLVRAVEAIRAERPAASDRVVLLSPQGRPFRHGVAVELARADRLILLCGRYEGVDERVRELVVDDEISVGDFVLTGGELPAMMLIDAVSRHVPGVLGDAEAAEHDSFADGLLDYPQYTRPKAFRGREVPEVLLSGDHGAIARWRRDRALDATRTKRPDILEPSDGA